MFPYINIHTHHLSKDNGVFLFNYRFGINNHIDTHNYFSIGVHPWDSGNVFNESELVLWIQHPNCKAIGECGLDKSIGITIEQQRKVFEQQIQLAVQFQKPIIIHCVRAFEELIEICKPYHQHIPLIIHGYQKNSEQAQQLIKQGFYLSLSHSFFAKKQNKQLSFCDKLFLETDDKPDLSIKLVYKLAADYFKISEDELKIKIYSNFKTLFKI